MKINEMKTKQLLDKQTELTCKLHTVEGLPREAELIIERDLQIITDEIRHRSISAIDFEELYPNFTH